MLNKFAVTLFQLIWLICMVYCWEDTLNGVTVQVQEISGTLRISNENNSITIAFKEIVEMAENGVTEVGTRSQLKHRFRNFDFQPFYSDGPGYYVDEYSDEAKTNISVYRKNFTATLNGPGATFNLEVSVYENDTIIRNSNSDESYQVYNGTVKFAFSISNWLFCGSNDTKCINYDHTDLEYGYYLDVYANYVAARKDDPPTAGRVRGKSEIYGRRPATYNYGGAEVTSSQMYMQNFTWHSLPRDYPKQIRKRDHNFIEKNYEIVRIPAFYSPIYYAAFVNISTLKYETNSANHECWCVFKVFFAIFASWLFQCWCIH